jgi:protein-L-isoaspartate(D-aspartate) O-methyltransferase
MYADQRDRLLDEIVRAIRATARDTGRDKLSEPVLRAMRTVPRHRFVPPELARDAYRDQPLPIGRGQTISQPTIVALMTDLLEPGFDVRVLEIGTGSGYQAAVLAECVAKVYTIEIVAPLGERAREVLEALGYKNVEVRIGDGYKGWPRPRRSTRSSSRRHRITFRSRSSISSHRRAAWSFQSVRAMGSRISW